MEECFFVRVKFKGQGGNNNGKDLSVVRTWPCRGQRSQPFESAHAPSLAGESSDRKDRRGRRDDIQGSRLFQVPEVGLRQKSRSGNGSGIAKNAGGDPAFFMGWREGVRPDVTASLVLR